MAVDPFPGAPDPSWDDFVDGHQGPPQSAGAPAAPRVGELDIQALTAALVAAQQVTKAATHDTQNTPGKVPDWAKNDAARVAYWTVAAPTIVTGCANIAVHAYGTLWPSLCGGAATVIGLVMGIAGMNRAWPQGFNSVVLGLAVGGITWTTAATGSGWMDVFAWLGGTAAALGFKLMYERNHAGHRLDLEEKREDIRLKQARTRTETFRGDAITAQSQIKAAIELARLQTMMQPEQAPYLGGVTSEEAAIRKAVWEVHEEQLLTCDVTPTRTGWTAVVGLPSQLSRKDARTSWDRVASAMKLDGRMKCADGRRTNELVISFVDNSRTDLESMTGWHPGAAWAVVADTGETIPVPLGRRILFAGCSGSGKSWSARPLMAEASEHEDHRLILIDRKHTEARNWQHRARIATEADHIDQVTDELIREGEQRLKLIPRGRDTVQISANLPRLTVFVDEGGELLSDLEEQVIERLRTIARKYRAAEIILVWCTQKPSLSGNGHGLDSQISAQLTHKLSLTAATPNESRVIFGEDAGDKGWDAHELPLKGWALLRDIETQAAPARLRMRAMSPADVIALPSRPVWFPGGDRYFEGDEQYLGVPEVPPVDRVAAFLEANPGASKREVAKGAGVPEGSAQRLIEQVRKSL